MESLGGWPGILGRISSGQDLRAAEAAVALGDVLEGNATPAQLAAFIFGLRCKGETIEEMAGLVRAMLDAAVIVELPPDLAGRVIDTCGTGGDRHGTINVSTIAALVVAGAGVPVCKHGGRAASSLAGSADVLEALGVAIELDAAGVARCIQEAGIGFCFAPRFHANLRFAIPIRRELGVPTAFNFLGPLANPGRVRRQVVGVGDPAMAPKMAGVLAANGAHHVAVVYGHDGLDELSTTAPSTMITWRADTPPDGPLPEGPVPGGAGPVPGSGLVEVVVDPAALGLAPAALEDLRGGDAAANAGRAQRILAGEKGPQRDVVLLNAAAGLMVGGAVPSLAEGLVLAAEALDSGAAEAALARLVAVSQDAQS